MTTSPMNLKKWLYRGGRPNWLASIANRCWASVYALGVAPRDRFSTYQVTFRRVVGSIQLNVRDPSLE